MPAPATVVVIDGDVTVDWNLACEPWGKHVWTGTTVPK